LHEHRAPLEQKARFSDFPRVIIIIIISNITIAAELLLLDD